VLRKPEVEASALCRLPVRVGLHSDQSPQQAAPKMFYASQYPSSTPIKIFAQSCTDVCERRGHNK
jgi:hypothetical protein